MNRGFFQKGESDPLGIVVFAVLAFWFLDFKLAPLIPRDDLPVVGIRYTPPPGFEYQTEYAREGAYPNEASVYGPLETYGTGAFPIESYAQDGDPRLYKPSSVPGYRPVCDEARFSCYLEP
ncbi:MAG: hypothetical protein V4674_00770 [Patescibacteria group bacterium]